MQSTTSTSIVDPNDTFSHFRCVVEEILSANSYNVKIVNAVRPNYVSENMTGTLALRLQGEWATTTLELGDIINIVATSSLFERETRSIQITSEDNLLVVQPDILLSPSVILTSLSCTRKAFLSSLISGQRIENEAIIKGRLLHETMQACIKNNIWTECEISKFLDAAVAEERFSIMRLNADNRSFLDTCRESVATIAKFGEDFVGTSPKTSAYVTNAPGTTGSASHVAFNEFWDTEREIWSPRLGLRGRLDAVAKTSIIPIDSADRITRIVPLEIKTGRSLPTIEHVAQTLTYMLMLDDAVENDVVDVGLIYHTTTGSMLKVAKRTQTIAQIIMLRNEIAAAIARKRELALRQSQLLPALPSFNEADIFPEVTTDVRNCTHCRVADACTLYYNAYERDDDSRSNLAPILNQKSSHLTDAHVTFFLTWERLLSMEELDTERYRHEIWTMDAKSRELLGRCAASMQLTSTSRNDQSSDHSHHFRFTQSSHYHPDVDREPPFKKGDRVLLSFDNGATAVGRGEVIDIDARSIVVGSSNPILLGAFEARPSDTARFRIDKDDFFNGISKLRRNVTQLFYPSTNKWIGLIVDLNPPIFRKDRLEVRKVKPATLNSAQGQAIDNVLAAEDYAVISGMPGTGKTTVIASAISILVEAGNTVLLASYTHSAVDSTLIKLHDMRIPFTRLGRKDKINPRIHDSIYTHTNGESVSENTNNVRVVGTTCFSADHPMLASRRFDYCILDEASQITLPTSLAPIMLADRLILIGDDKQLPPLVLNDGAKKMGLETSLFKRLSSAHPFSVTHLVEQYRMSADIMALSNHVIYDMQLQMGNPDATRARPKTPIEQLGEAEGTRWLDIATDGKHDVFFIATDAIQAQESYASGSIVNTTEARLVSMLVMTLLDKGLPSTSIDIITPYQQQVHAIKNALLDTSRNNLINVMTADQSQGRENDCIIVSMVRSNDRHVAGSLLRDKGRINVLITRARRKLLILGSQKTLETVPTLKVLLNFMDDRNWILRLVDEDIGSDDHNTGEKRKRDEEVPDNTRHNRRARLALAKRSTITKDAIRFAEEEEPHCSETDRTG